MFLLKNNCVHTVELMFNLLTQVLRLKTPLIKKKDDLLLNPETRWHVTLTCWRY